MAKIPNLDLIFKDIKDPYVQENFTRLLRYLEEEPVLQGNFKFFCIEIPEATTQYRFKHNLGFRPQDIILLSAEGDRSVQIHHNLSTKDYVYFTVAGKSRLRFLAGSYDNDIPKSFTDIPDIPPVTPSAGSLTNVNGSISSGGSPVVDTLDTGTILAADYLITITNIAKTIVKTVKAHVVMVDGDTQDNVYSRMGSLDVDIGFQLSGSDIQLQLTNNEAFTVNYSATRITT